MPLQKEYYFNKLYPLQNAILEIIAECKTDFYLTGGTALSRFYLHHRFSDDLDFFVNDSPSFKAQAELILSEIKNSSINMVIDKRAEDFVRISCSNNEAELKVDFVNDIPYHSGNIEKFELFPRIDGWWNILSNKITALERREPKDIADILYICRKYTFDWETVIYEGQQKTTYLDPLDISVILSEFPKQYFTRIHWISDIYLNEAYDDLQKIAKNILLKEKNSLA
jgi:predicted nucleotidyltransferase component of viral defense system